ncbi:MAG: hypothetical protein BWX56_00152 [Euryarchaeota archaeon ADurb.Bin023]|nr:MAG: hypothetical protein BWX56_00152 [Euryarchaeota archaeon ADurb.Bin023]HPU91421.1 hypothetical protein [Methanofastidiosum sp.]
MAKSVDVFEKRHMDVLPMLSREELYSLHIFDLSEMIISIEHAIRYTEGYRFLLLCFGSDGSSDKAKAVIKGMEDYLGLVKDVYRFKVNEKKRKMAFLKGDIY